MNNAITKLDALYAAIHQGKWKIAPYGSTERSIEIEEYGNVAENVDANVAYFSIALHNSYPAISAVLNAAKAVNDEFQSIHTQHIAPYEDCAIGLRGALAALESQIGGES